MKKIGLIGGTGPESTLIYYKELNRIINEKMGNKLFPEITIESLDLHKALGYCIDEKYELLEKYLLDAINNLAKCGAQIGALTAATMHIVYDTLKEKSPIPLISIPETVCEVAVNRGYKKIGLLGTIFTMQKNYMKTPFTKKGIEIVIPSNNDLQLVNHRISTELEYGIVKESTRKELIDVIEKMKDDGAQAIILGCTELPLILNQENCPIDCLDIMKIHIEKIAELAMK